MREFFNYQSPYRTGIFLELSVLEKIIPVLVILIIGLLIYKYRFILRENKLLDKRIRYGLGIVWFIIYSSHYIFRFVLYGFDTIILPFHLCSISMFLGVILLFTNNKTIFTYVMLTGIAGGLISLAFPILGYNSAYYRYYQFYIAHGILVLVPLYYVFVYQFMPSGKEIFKSFLILQGLAVFMAIFNYYYNTDFLFLFLDKEKITKFPAIASFGGIPYYLIFVEMAGLLYYYGVHLLLRFIEKKQLKTTEVELQKI